MKYIVIGSSHAGYEAVQTLIEEPTAEIHLYERESKPSFMACGAQSYLEGTSQSLDELHYASEDSYKNQGVHVHVNSDVVDIDTENKIITVQSADGETETNYDKLIISPGGYAPKLDIPGNDLEHVYTFRGRGDTGLVKERMTSAEKVIVVGSGYIGIEVAEAYVKNGQEVLVLDALEHFLPTYLDDEFYNSLSEEAEEYKMEFQGNEFVQEILGEDGQVTGVKTDKGTYQADTVIMAVGVKPATSWLKGSVDLDDDGFVVTNDYLQTSADDVYACGDAVLNPYGPTGKKANVGLATTSRIQGVIAAKNALGKQTEVPAVNGTSALSFFDLKFAATGLNNSYADHYDGEVKSHYMKERIRPSFMRDGDTMVEMKILFDANTERILGGQFMSTEDVTQAANTISLAISTGMTLTDLAQADFYFQPGYDRPWHYLNVLAMAAKGETHGATKMLF